MAPIDINNQEIDSITLNGNTEIDTVTVDGQTVFSVFTPFFEDFSGLNPGDSLDGYNGWFDNPDFFSAKSTPFSGAGNTWNTPSPAIGRTDDSFNSSVAKGAIGRSIPPEAYTNVSFYFGIDGSSENGSVFVSLRQGGNDIILVEIDDDGGGDDADTSINNSLIVNSVNESDGEIGNDFVTNEFIFNIDYDSNTTSGTITSEKTGFSVNFSEQLLTNATAIDEIYLWRSAADGMFFDELSMTQ